MRRKTNEENERDTQQYHELRLKDFNSIGTAAPYLIGCFEKEKGSPAEHSFHIQLTSYHLFPFAIMFFFHPKQHLT